MLSVGEKAPVIKGKDQNGNSFSSSQFKGKKWVVYFYPKDNTPSCTNQACNIRDHYSTLKKRGIEIIGISPDSVQSHKKFEAKFNLPFTLIADENQQIAQAYGVWGPKKFMGKEYIGLHRTTFLIDEKGKIAAIITRPKTKAHVEEILALWQSI